MPCRLLDDTDASDTDTVKLANVMAAPCIISGRYVRARHDEPSAEGSVGMTGQASRQTWPGKGKMNAKILLRHDARHFQRRVVWYGIQEESFRMSFAGL